MRRIVFLILSFFLLTGTANAKFTVNTSLYIISTIVKYIGKDRVEVSYIVPPSSNPHLFSPTPRSLGNFEDATLFIGVGCGLEFWFDRVSYLRKGKPNLFLCDFYKNPLGVFRLGKKIYANPHIWFDLTFMKSVAIPKIVKEMCRLDVKDCNFFKIREHKFVEQLGKIIAKYKSFFKNHRDLCFVDVKPAFEYLFKSMGRSSCGVVKKDESSMPRLGDLKGLLKSCRCRSGLVVYIQDFHMAKSIAHLLGYKSVFLNPLGNNEDERLNGYLKLLVFNLGQLERAVR